MDVQNLLDRFEAFKLKWLQLNEQDIHDWLSLKDDINDAVIELESKFLEWDALYDRDYWLRLVELKEKKDLEGKKRYTDATAKAICDNEFFDRKIDLIVMKETYKKLMKKSELIEPYTNAVKFYLRRDFSM